MALAVAMASWYSWDAMHGVDFTLAGAASETLSGALLPINTLGALLWCGFITTALVLWGETFVMKKVPSTDVGVIFSTEPLWATLSAVVLLGDHLTTQEACGGALILMACLGTQVKLGGDDA